MLLFTRFYACKNRTYLLLLSNPTKQNIYKETNSLCNKWWDAVFFSDGLLAATWSEYCKIAYSFRIKEESVISILIDMVMRQIYSISFSLFYGWKLNLGYVTWHEWKSFRALFSHFHVDLLVFGNANSFLLKF